MIRISYHKMPDKPYKDLKEALASFKIVAIDECDDAIDIESEVVKPLQLTDAEPISSNTKTEQNT